MTLSPAKRTILVVDDYEAQRYTLSRVLEGGGFSVLTAGNGAEALARVRERPDIVLLDVGLPDMNGFEVCRAIKTNPRTAGIPIVFLSGTHMSQDDITEGERLGAGCFLFQPVSGEDLLAVVGGVLAKAAAKRRGTHPGH